MKKKIPNNINTRDLNIDSPYSEGHHPKTHRQQTLEIIYLQKVSKENGHTQRILKICNQEFL